MEVKYTATREDFSNLLRLKEDVNLEKTKIALFTNMPSANPKYRARKTNKEGILAELNAWNGFHDFLEKGGFKISTKGEKIVIYKPIVSRYVSDNEIAFQYLLHAIDLNTNIYVKTGYYGASLELDKVYHYRVETASTCAYMKGKWSYTFETFYGLQDTYRELLEMNKKVSEGEEAFLGYYVVDYVLKDDKKSTERVLDEEYPKMVDFLNNILKTKHHNKFYASLEVGKRQCDSESKPYKAIVISYTSDKSYCKMIRITQDEKFGDCRICVAQPLCGEFSGDFDLEHWEDKIENYLYN